MANCTAPTTAHSIQGSVLVLQVLRVPPLVMPLPLLLLGPKVRAFRHIALYIPTLYSHSLNTHRWQHVR
jgi:hypothetical protein